MPELPKKKVGLVSCSGEEMAEGTVTRLATRKVLENLRPDDTVTICLPLFLAGGEGERAFARSYPTITIDGCEKRCAAKGTERYSGKPAESIVVTESCHVPFEGLGTARRLNGAGVNAVKTIADEIALNVERLLAGDSDENTSRLASSDSVIQESPAAPCSCVSGIDITVLEIAGRSVEVLALPLIFDKFRMSGKTSGCGAELMETVRLYNSIPDNEQESWEKVIEREYAAYLAREAR
jgi:hypothetical protein